MNFDNVAVKAPARSISVDLLSEIPMDADMNVIDKLHIMANNEVVRAISELTIPQA